MGNKNRYKSKSLFDMQFITSSISTTLVLLLLGLVVFFVLTAHNMSVYVRENISFSVLISDDMKEADILKLQKKLNQEPFVKQSEYISKKQALKEQTEAMGTDPEEFLGYNPFTASLEIKLHSDYANSDSIAKIEKMIKKNSNIQDVLYRKELIDAVNENIRNISLVLLALAVVLTFIYDTACHLLQAVPHSYHEAGGCQLEFYPRTFPAEKRVERRIGRYACRCHSDGNCLLGGDVRAGADSGHHTRSDAHCLRQRAGIRNSDNVVVCLHLDE